MIASRAAVAHEAGKPLSIETVNVDGPREGEVLVEIRATGVCHTDAFTLSGEDPEGLFPAILGHEGAGVVVEVGKGVTTLSEGDHVIPLYTPECRVCEYCTSDLLWLNVPFTGLVVVTSRQEDISGSDSAPQEAKKKLAQINQGLAYYDL